MNKKRLFLAGLILIGISLAFGASWQTRRINARKFSSSPQQSQVTWNLLNQVKVEDSKEISVAPFIDQGTFEAGWRMYSKTSRPVACEGVFAGLVNHHVLAIDLLVHFFVEARRCRPDLKTLIIVSPDHYLVGTSPITTSEENYLVYGKIVESEKSRLRWLQKEIPSVQFNPTLFLQEHGVGALVPFVAKLWPDAKIVPFVVRSDIDRETSRVFSQWLQEQSKDPHVFILVSSDMSHYLDEKTARKNDDKTKQAFQINDEAFFWNAKDGFTDNGRGISTVMKAVMPMEWIELEQGISTDYQGSPGFTTSYLTGFWKR